MRRYLTAAVCIVALAGGPAFAQAGAAAPAAAEQPIPVEHTAPQGSSGPSASLAVGGSSILVLVGLVTVVTLGVIAAAAND